MKKNSIILLGLVAITASCSKGGGIPKNDIFTKVRAKKVSSVIKKQVQESLDEFSFKSTLKATYLNYEKVDGEWSEITKSETEDTYITTCSMHKEMPHCKFETILNEGSEAESTVTIFEVATVGGKYKFIDDNEHPPHGDWYYTSPKKIYNLLYNSIFSWKASFFAGSTYFLTSVASTVFMPQEALNYFAKSFEVTYSEESDGSLMIADIGTFPVYTGQIRYQNAEIELIRFVSIYNDYLLKSYNCQFEFGTIYNGEGKVIKNAYRYSMTIEQIDYLYR